MKYPCPALAGIVVLTHLVCPTPSTAQQSTGPRVAASRPAPEALGPITQRYIVLGARSVKTPQSNVASVIRILNTSTATCNYLVRFAYLQNNLKICDVSIEGVAPNEGRAFCSRSVPDGSNAAVASCSATCDPEVVFNESRATIFSTNSNACAFMVVDALQIYTNTDDTVVQGIRTPTIVKVTANEVAKTNKGD